jgi:predicted O-linked N-acetylglucosamine transferase (SPINDLY family)
MFETWLRLLKDIPHSVLWLIDDNATTTHNLKMHARAAGADMSRIAFTPRTSHEEYKAKLAVADVFLDTYPYNCGSTSNDVISVGLTLVTISGRTLVSRMGGSIIQALGLPKHVVAKNHSDYADAILKISEKRKQVNQLSVRIQQTTTSPKSNITQTIEQFTNRHSSC